MAQIQICPRFWLGAAWPQLKAVWPSPSATWPGKIIRVLWEIHMEITWNTSKTIYESLWGWDFLLPDIAIEWFPDGNCYYQRVMVISDHGHQAFESWSKLQIRSLPDWVSAMRPHPPGRLSLPWILGSNQIKWLMYIECVLQVCVCYVCVCVVCCVCKINWYDAWAHRFLGKFYVQSVHQQLCNPVCAHVLKMKPSPPVHRNKTVCEHSSSQKMGCADKSWRCKWLTSDDTLEVKKSMLGELKRWTWRDQQATKVKPCGIQTNLNSPIPAAKGAKLESSCRSANHDKQFQVIKRSTVIHLPDLIGGQPIKVVSSDSR